MKYDLEKISRVLEKEIENNSPMRVVSEKLDIPFSTFKRIAKKLNLYVPNQGREGLPGIKKSLEEKNKIRIPLEKILNNEIFYQSGKLKPRLIEVGLKKEICEECGLGNEWNGKKLHLHLDHKDGNKFNNNLENLKILCPNCHTQTPTYAGRNVRLKNIRNGYIYPKKKFTPEERKEYYGNIKKSWEEEQKDYIHIILNSGIDFSRFGWVNKVAPIIKQKPQKVNKWMKRIMPEFYEKCFKRRLD